VLDEIGAPTDRLLERRNLPISGGKSPIGYVPVLSVWEFAQDAADSQSMWDFGFRIAEFVTIGRAARWGRRVVTAATLHEAACIMSESIAADMPNVSTGLEWRGNDCWLWRDHQPDRRHMPGSWLGEQYILGLMIQLVRMVEGPGWYPTRLELQASRSEWSSHRPEIIGDSQISFSAPRTAIELPAHSLAAPLRQSFSQPGSLPLPLGQESPPEDLAGALHEVLKSLVLDRRPDLHLGASIMRTSERSVRRHLAREGTSWREVLSRAEAQVATTLIANPDNKLTEVAEQLGYSQYAHFYRAFRRWTGDSPSDYRQNLLSR
jgi:AraC-like DNA-binding protein